MFAEKVKNSISYICLKTDESILIYHFSAVVL